MVPVLQTTRFRLRPFNQHDADSLYTLLKQEKVVTAHPAHPVSDRHEANHVLQAMNEDVLSGTALYWLIEEKTSQRFTGRIGFKHINHQNNSAALMVEVLPELWGENILYETGRAVIAYGFSQLQLHRVEAQVVPEHPYMHSFLKRVGFHLEGLLQSWVKNDYGLLDYRIYSLLKTDDAWKTILSTSPEHFSLRNCL
ncbi:GNAT family protein [Kistimonas scapharcae]|uniref:GNAT family protein n=1 Tax=Kistimonas scapharcae TaxID=1036133 RepID=A0ABP8V500_9GAMM